jgi:biotin carboxyl carrier protein
MNEQSQLNVDDTIYETEVPARRGKPFRGFPDPREVRAFIPGVIAEVRVKRGQKVGEGDVLLLLEAMKMFNEVCAACGGHVREIMTKPGDRVEKEQLLLRLI